LLYICLVLLLPLHAFAQSTVTWTPVGPSGSLDRIVALAVNPVNDSIVYAAAPGGGIWKSQDAGATWSPVFETQSSLQVCSLAIDPLLPDVVYAGTGDGQSPRDTQGVARSTDGGQTWTAQARMTTRPVCALAIDPTNTSRIFAGSAEGLFISSDSGATWAKVLSSAATSVAFGAPGIVYAGVLGDTSSGAPPYSLSRSSDGGRTWTSLAFPLASTSAPTANSWVSVLATNNTVFAAISYQTGAGSQLDFYSSSDGGNLWVPTFGVGQASPPVALVMDAGGNLYLGGKTLLTSSDSGSTWTVIPTRTTNFHAAGFTGGALLLAGEKGFELAGSSRVLSEPPVAQIVGVGMDPAGHIWTGGPAGLFSLSSSSVTGGVPGIGAVGRVAVAATSTSTHIFAAGPDQIYESTDGGATFSSQAVIPSTEPRALYPPLAVDPVITSSAFVAGRRVYHTTDSGANWTQLAIVDPDRTRVVTALAMAPAARSTLFAATACLPEVSLTSCPPVSAVWRSTNSGQTWVQMSLVNGFVNKFAIDPRQSTRVYAAIGAFPAGPSIPAGLIQGDILVSTTAGTSWSSSLGNLPRTSINTVVIDPTSLPALFTQAAQTVYVGTDAGVFVSFDAGTRWMNVSSGLPASPITEMTLLQPDGILVAGTFGRGAYSATVLGLSAGLIAQPLSQEITLMHGTTDSVGLSLNNLSASSSVDWQLTTFDTWLTPEPNGTIRPLASAQVAVGVSALTLQSGTYVGRLQLISSSGVQNVFIEAHVIPAVSQMTITGGNNGSGLPGSSLPPLQILVLDERNDPLPGVPVMFTITSGGGTLSDRTVTTDVSGTASAILTLPSKPAAVQVVASVGTISVSFAETAISAPALLTDSIFDAVTFNPSTSLGPGSILAIQGQNLASTEVVASGSLPASLASTRVLVSTPSGDVALSLFSVSPTQIKALLPLDISPGSYMMHVELGSIRGNDVEISVAAFDPGIFTINGTGYGPGVFFKNDGSIITASNPADRGTTVSFFAAGLGPVSPPVPAGAPGVTVEPLNRTLQVPRVFFDRYSGAISYSGLAPGMTGRYLVTVQVPALVSPATNVSVSMTIGGFTSNRVTIPVR
jgi:uncharacterized protein (TIGR03437 family)